MKWVHGYSSVREDERRTTRLLRDLGLSEPEIAAYFRHYSNKPVWFSVKQGSPALEYGKSRQFAAKKMVAR